MCLPSCRLAAEKMLLGSEVEAMSNEELAAAAEYTTVFAKLAPAQKARVVRLLRENGHSVGYLAMASTMRRP